MLSELADGVRRTERLCTDRTFGMRRGRRENSVFTRCRVLRIGQRDPGPLPTTCPCKDLPQGGKERPLLIVMEEAHNYLGSNNSSRASRVVRRIVKEGRKYGISAMIVSQRPSEIDPTILSQCGTTIALRLTNSNDRGIIANTVSDNLSNLVNMLPILKTGESIIVGEAVRMPMRASIFFPDKTNRPDSNDPVVASDEENKGGWNNPLDITEEEYKDIVKAWRLQQVNL